MIVLSMSTIILLNEDDNNDDDDNNDVALHSEVHSTPPLLAQAIQTQTAELVKLVTTLQSDAKERRELLASQSITTQAIHELRSELMRLQSTVHTLSRLRGQDPAPRPISTSASSVVSKKIDVTMHDDACSNRDEDDDLTDTPPSVAALAVTSETVTSATTQEPSCRVTDGATSSDFVRKAKRMLDALCIVENEVLSSPLCEYDPIM